MTEVSVAEAKRRFSELLDRVGDGERFIVSRRGKPAVGLVPPREALEEHAPERPAGLLSVAGALADWDEIEEAVSRIYADRHQSRDRSVPDLE
jgi:prevent-host-death family protein